jgi:hypothetical protein
MTVTSFQTDAPNTSVATSIAAADFWDIVLTTYGDVAAGMR